MSDNPYTKCVTKKADAIAEESIKNIKLKIESGEWGPKEIDKFMKDLTVKFKEITGKDYEGTSSLKKMDDKAKKEEK